MTKSSLRSDYILIPAMSLAQDSLMPQPVRIPVSQECLEVMEFWILDVGFIEFRGLRPPNLLIVNSHLSIVNGQGGIGGIWGFVFLTKSTRCVGEGEFRLRRENFPVGTGREFRCGAAREFPASFAGGGR